MVLTIYSKTLTRNILKDNILFSESNESLFLPLLHGGRLVGEHCTNGRVLGRASLGYENFSRDLCDIESVINSRPPTYIPEASDEITPLSPLMFLQHIVDCSNWSTCPRFIKFYQFDKNTQLSADITKPNAKKI